MIASTLELHVLSYAGGEAGVGQSVRLGHSPISIGRSPACHLSLDDAERLISRSHVSAWLDAHGKAWVRNASSSTPVFVEGLELAPGAQTGIQAGQTLVLGRYLLGIRGATAAAQLAEPSAVQPVANDGGSSWNGGGAGFSPIPEEFDVFAAPVHAATASGGSATSCGLGEFSGESAALSEVFEALPAFDARGPQQAPELLDLVGGARVERSSSAPDPLKQLLGESSSLLDFAGGPAGVDGTVVSQHSEEIDGLFRMPVSAAAAAPQAAATAIAPGPAQVGPAAQAKVDGLDPLALDLGSDAMANTPAGQSLLDLIADASPQAMPPAAPGALSALDGLLEPAPPQAVPGVAAAMADAAAARVRSLPSTARMAEPEPVLPAGFDTAHARRSPGVAPIAEEIPVSPAQRVSPEPLHVAAEPVSPPAPMRPAGGQATRSGASMAAFARGCGLHPAQLGDLDEATLEKLGQLFQSLVAGTLQLIHARSSTKDELRAHMTIIATSGNNPLKFAPDAQAAMLQLVGRGLPGFMPPVEAVRDAFSDLSAHQVGLLAASRSAMYAMAGRLSPEHIQQRVGGPRGFSGLLPSAHKAQLWDAFVAAHAQLLGEAREEFDAAFQGAFVDAYEGEVRRVQSGSVS